MGGVRPGRHAAAIRSDIQHVLFGWFFRLNLWPRLAIVVVLGFAVLFTITTAVALAATGELAEQLFKDRRILAEVAAREIDDFIDSIEQELTASTASEPDPASTRQALRHFFRRVGADVLSVSVYDSAGRLIWREPEGQDDLSVQVGEALRSRHKVVYAPVLDGSSGRYGIVVVVPLQLGAVAAIVDLDGPHLSRILVQAKMLGQTGHAVLVDRDGLVLSSTEPWERLQPGEHLQFYREAATDQQGVARLVPCEPCPEGEKDVEHLMAWAPLRSGPWGVAVGGSAAESLAPVYRLRIQILAVGLGLLAVILGVTLIGAKLLVRPVEYLIRTGEQLAAGNLDVEIRVHEGGEIGVLAETLDRMRVQLRESLAALKRWGEELEAQVRNRTAELERLHEERGRILGRVLDIQEEERQRIARELHDEVGQTIAALVIKLRMLERTVRSNGDPELVNSLIKGLQTEALAALESVRRVSAGLRPSVLDELGLIAAVEQCLRDFRQRFGIEVELEARLPPGHERLPGAAAMAIYRILQEALSNVARHAGASRVAVRVGLEDGMLVLTVADNGRGFDVAGVLSGPVEGKLGLLGMQERAAVLGGRFSIHSVPGLGTTVRVALPLVDKSP